jgi:excisionase family DNA binding protein
VIRKSANPYEPTVIETCQSESCPREVGAAQVACDEAGSPQVSAGKITLFEGSVQELRIAQIGIRKVDPNKFGTLEYLAPQKAFFRRGEDRMQTPRAAVAFTGDTGLSCHDGNPLQFKVVLRNIKPVSNFLRKSAEESVKIGDRLMTARQVAAYLNVNERTVLKLVSEGLLPGVKIGNQWRFRKAMLDAWLDDQMLGVVPQHLELKNRTHAPRRMLDLASCFQPSHVVPELAATTKIGVIEELADSANRLGLVRDKNWFVGALIERENIMPSAVGNGVAFLHTMNRHPEQVVRPFMVLGRSRAGVDFDALDGRPTHLFFVLGLKFHELQLPWLAKLAQLFAHPEATEALIAAPNASAMFESLSQAERSLFPAHSGN